MNLKSGTTPYRNIINVHFNMYLKYGFEKTKVLKSLSNEISVFLEHNIII